MIRKLKNKLRESKFENKSKNARRTGRLHLDKRSTKQIYDDEEEL